MNKIIAIVSLVAILGLAGVVAWQSRGAGADEPPRRGTRAYYATETAAKSTETAAGNPLGDARLCLAEGRPADCRD